MQTEKEKFSVWMAKKQEEGMCQFHVSSDHKKVAGMSEEEYYKSLNNVAAIVDSDDSQPFDEGLDDCPRFTFDENGKSKWMPPIERTK